eukprot:Em0037g28a
MASQFYEVERIVASRKKGTKLEYLVLWTDYPKEQASWVRHKDVTPALLRSFVNPTPSIRVVTVLVYSCIMLAVPYRQAR